MPVLDTNVLIGLAHGHPAATVAIRRALADGPLLVPAQAALEFLAGVQEPVESLRALRRSFVLVHSDDDQVLEGATLRARVRGKAAERPRWADIRIAAVARLEGTYVVTTNKRHFTQLGVPAWHFTDEADPPASPN